jgi:hypothetical protein
MGQHETIADRRQDRAAALAMPVVLPVGGPIVIAEVAAD